MLSFNFFKIYFNNTFNYQDIPFVQVLEISSKFLYSDILKIVISNCPFIEIYQYFLHSVLNLLQFFYLYKVLLN